MSVRKVSGFTLFEIMVTVAIAGIVAAFAIPGFQSVMSSSRLNAASQEVANAAALARNTAISRRRTVVWQPDTASATPAWNLRLDSISGPSLARHVLSSPMTMASTVAFSELQFQPNGYVQRKDGTTLAAMDGEWRLCDSSTRKEVGRSVTISRVGRIRVVPHTDATTCNP
jgi:prepilin-type N-terminal cleavage/methylation domain-containing protein